MKPSHLAELLTLTIPERLPILLTGPPGVGKTDIVHQASAACFHDVLVTTPSVADPSDYKGLPWVEDGVARFLPLGQVRQVLAATEPTVWFFDDLGQAAGATQAGVAHWFLAREVEGHKLPDCVTCIAATNRRGDRSGVQGILDMVKGRFCEILEFEPDLDDWCNWAINNALPVEVIAFLRYRPEFLFKYEPNAELTKWPCPRSWSHLANRVKLQLPNHLRYPSYAATIGQGAAAEYLAFEQMFASLVTADSILLDPHGAKLPADLSQYYAVSTALAARANVSNFDAVAIYSERMANAGFGEFASLTIRDSVRRDSSLETTGAFIKAMCGPIGKLVAGEVR